MSKAQIFDIYAQKISDISHVPYNYIVQLRAMGFLDNKSVRDLLIRHDYCTLIKTKKYTQAQILAKLEDVHNVSIGKIKEVIKQNRKYVSFCYVCGARISRDEHQDNNGMCNRCFSRTIKL